MYRKKILSLHTLTIQQAKLVCFLSHQKPTLLPRAVPVFGILNAFHDSVKRSFRFPTKDSAADCSVGFDSVPGSGSGFDSDSADSGTGSAAGSDSGSAVNFDSAPDFDFDVTSMHSFSPHKQLPACRSPCGTANDIPS